MTFPGNEVDAKVKKFETDIDDVSSGNAEEFEKLLRRMRYFLHENHYWILEAGVRALQNTKGRQHPLLLKDIVPVHVTLVKSF